MLAGAVTVSILILILSGFVVVTVESVVDVEDCILLVSTAAESELLDDIDDSLVPQLTAINPKPKLNNKNFFIIFILWCMSKYSITIPKWGHELLKYQ
ncbi:hypothetical protein A0O34_15835 [Chryseobacterium glaciei]|uniref:Uncharacterized protein n=1 Tax=Chryseobacterium glaciei TaxID=1685010 RepID=A0A172XXZ5_9FLAO|nr:hypothetical protein A0O34_15835 [Chryseobacterium glaciei]